jgi:hypothetical protein
MELEILWTPVFTGETNTVGPFHSFPLGRERILGLGSPPEEVLTEIDPDFMSFSLAKCQIIC